MLANVSDAAVRREWTLIETAARALGAHPQLLNLRKSDALGAMFDDAGAQRADALIVMMDNITQTNRQGTIDLAMKRRLPAIYPSRDSSTPGD